MREGDTVFRRAYGLADLELGVPMRPEMVFQLGSISKQFTALAVMILAEAGKLSLDDEITRHLPDYPMHGHQITIRHLLTHTSGIKNHNAMQQWRKRLRDDLTTSELIAIFEDQPLEFAPGEQWKYGNSGYVLLSAIIERASNQTYEQFLRESIFEPLDMTATCVSSIQHLIPNRARGYEIVDGRLENARFVSPTHLSAGGGLMSTVDDLARWDQSLYGEALISRAGLEEYFVPVALSNGDTTGYALGWQVGELKGRTCVSHGGASTGLWSTSFAYPKSASTLPC